jgi:hypothetical protein
MSLLAHDEIQRRALRAAAKVALTMSTATVFGACGGMTDAGPSASGPDAAGDSATSAADVAVADTATSVDTSKPVPDAVVDATACGVTPDAATTDQLDCCAAKVKATFSDTEPEPVDAGPAPDPGLVACCGELVKAYDGSTHDYGLTFAQARACCYVLPGQWYEHGGVACTPWGPPMPPAMTGDFDDEEALS